MKSDHRINYTKHVLQQSLLELLEEKPLNKITIKELCMKSNISRATFYAHYVDIYALITEIEKHIFSSFQLEEFLLNLDNDSFPTSLNLANILSLVKSHATFYKIFFNHHMHDGYMSKALVQLQSKITSYWVKKNIYSDQITADYAFVFCKNGVLAVIKEWLNKDALLQETPQATSEVINEILASVQKFASDTNNPG
ncbi:TetR/AcrR family transcriptional regulator [Paenibacillus illinoisensis]|uniref:TetR/AcrR family transcriptional regulator n=1 Tax=Paenibacillus illinoisensis TaxID=59845 RepID=A0ABW8HQW3_9BACL